MLSKTNPDPNTVCLMMFKITYHSPVWFNMCPLRVLVWTNVFHICLYFQGPNWNPLVWINISWHFFIAPLLIVYSRRQKITGIEEKSLHSIYIEITYNKAKTKKIMVEPEHPAHKYYQFIRSSTRQCAHMGGKRFTDSFYPKSVKVFNKADF